MTPIQSLIFIARFTFFSKYSFLWFGVVTETRWVYSVQCFWNFTILSLHTAGLWSCAMVKQCHLWFQL